MWASVQRRPDCCKYRQRFINYRKPLRLSGYFAVLPRLEHSDTKKCESAFEFCTLNTVTNRDPSNYSVA